MAWEYVERVRYRNGTCHLAEAGRYCGIGGDPGIGGGGGMFGSFN